MEHRKASGIVVKGSPFEENKQSLHGSLDEKRDISHLSSIYLEENPKFLELRERLDAYFYDIKSSHPRLHPEYSAEWKKILYTSLNKLLTEAVLTSNRACQEDVVEKVYK